jgi:parallel beta helix pectate lyase-like protein
MNSFAKPLQLVFLFLLSLVAVSPVFAAPSAVYVAFNGSDANPCTRLAACKTITHALTIVADEGAVVIVGSGIYDTFTITKAVSVEAEPGVVALIPLTTGAIGVTINADATDTVAVKGLSFRAPGAANATGIQANTGGSIVLENCDSRDVHFGAVLNSTTAAFKVQGGVYEATDTGLFIRAGTNNVSIDGVKIYGTSSNAAVDAVGQKITITHSVLAGSGTGGFAPGVWVKGSQTVVLENNVISGYGPGVQVGAGLGGTATVFLSNNTITNNSTGIVVGSPSFPGKAFTRGNNTFAANGTDVSGALTSFAAK